MMLSSLPPFALFFIGAVAVGFTKGLPRKVLVLVIPLLGGLNLWFNVDPGLHLQFQFLGEYTVTPFRADKLSLLFGYLFHLAAFLGFLYALHLGDGDVEHGEVMHSAEGPRHRLGARTHVELAVNIAQVSIDRVITHVEARGDGLHG